MKNPSTMFLIIVALIVGAVAGGPGLGLASGMAVWYFLHYQKEVFKRWPKIANMNRLVYGLLVMAAVLAANAIFFSLWLWGVQRSMG